MAGEVNPFDDTPPEDRLSQEAEDLMRQGRYQDAIGRYHSLRALTPTDPWAKLGLASALECNGQIREAESIIEEMATANRDNRHVQRFCALFFERREDMGRARRSQEVLQFAEQFDDGPQDQLAELYFNQGRYHEATTELQRILREESLDNGQARASVLARVGACLRQSDDLDEARQLLEEAAQLDANNHWIISELAETERAFGDIPRARAAYRRALELDPSDVWTRGRLANLEWEDGHTQEAIALYEQVLEREPKAVWAKVELAQALSDTDRARAVRLCQEALEQDGTYPWAYAQLGHLARDEGRLDEARNHYQKALAQSPQSLWLLHELADTCRQMGRLEEAYTHLNHAQNIAPFDATTHGYMADFLRNEGKNDEAMAYLHKAVELDGEYVWAWREICELHAMQGDHEAAERAFNQVQALEPDEAINDGLRAFLLRFQNRRDAALPYLERAVAKQPDYFWAWREIADYHLSTGQAAHAEAVCRQALEKVEGSVHLLTLLAESCRQQGKREEALRAVADGLAQDKEVAQLWAMRAELLISENRTEALHAATKACDYSDAPEYRVLLLQCLVVAGKLAKARNLLGPLTSEQALSPIPFDVAAELAEQSKDPQLAYDWCQRGLQRFPQALRLVLRQTRLALDLGMAQPLETLRPFLDQEQALPWPEVIPLLARGGDVLGLRRAAYRYIESVRNDNAATARAWLSLAEGLLQTRQINEAREALATSLKLDPQLLSAHLLASMLAEQDEDHESALQHLHVVQQQLDAGSHSEPSLDQVALMQQIALVFERAQRPDEAAVLWQKLSERHPDQAEIRLEQALFQVRQEDRAAGVPTLAELSLGDNTPEAVRQRALYHLALHDLQEEEPQRALGRLEQAARLSAANHILAAQSALLLGDAAQARVHLDACNDLDEQQKDVRERLLIRVLVHEQHLEEACLRAKTLSTAQPHSEACAVLAAECLVAAGELDQAWEILSHPSLPARPGLERLLWGACLLLEQQGPAHAFAWLGRNHSAADGEHALVRLFAAAWPEAWGHELPEASLDDCSVIPVLPSAVRHITQALMEQGHAELAATCWLHLARRAQSLGKHATSGEALRAAVWPLRLIGQRKHALRAAWQARAPLLFLRALLP